MFFVWCVAVLNVQRVGISLHFVFSSPLLHFQYPNHRLHLLGESTDFR